MQVDRQASLLTDQVSHRTLICEATLTESQGMQSAAVQALLANRGKLISGNADGTIQIWDSAAPFAQLALFSLPPSDRSAVCSLAQAEDILWCGHESGSIFIWDVETRKVKRNIVAAHGPIWALQSVVQGQELVASAGADGAVKLWDARQSSLARHFSTGCPVYALASGQGYLVSAGHDGAIHLWDPRGGSSHPLGSLQVPAWMISDLSAGSCTFTHHVSFRNVE